MDTRLMNEALRLCGQYVNATDGVFLTVDQKSDVVSVLQETWFSPQCGNGFMNQSINVDDILTMLRGTQVDEWQSNLLPIKNSVDRHTYYQDSSSYPSANHIIAAWVDDNEEHRSLLALFRPVNEQPFNHDDQQLAQRFSSHFRRALRTQRQSQGLSARIEINDRMIDALSLSMIIVNNKGIILHLNASAERLLSSKTHGLASNIRGGCAVLTQSTITNW